VRASSPLSSPSGSGVDGIGCARHACAPPASAAAPPSGAFTRQPWAACQAHWMPCSCPYRCKHACHRRCNAPVATHRWKRSCTVVAGPNSRGRARHWQPVRTTYSTPSKTRRVSIHGRPPLGCSAGRKIGSAIVHNSSGTRQIVGSTSDATSRLFKFYLRQSLPECSRVIGQILIRAR